MKRYSIKLLFNSFLGGYANKNCVKYGLGEIPHVALGIFKNKEEIISQIQKQEKINEEVKQKLKEYRKQINDLIFEYLTDEEEAKND